MIYKVMVCDICGATIEDGKEWYPEVKVVHTGTNVTSATGIYKLAKFSLKNKVSNSNFKPVDLCRNCSDILEEALNRAAEAGKKVEE